jgi:hypothetical protein
MQNEAKQIEVTEELISDHFTLWADAGDPVSGFAAWAHDAREETLDVLKDDCDYQGWDALRDEVIYSVREGIKQRNNFPPPSEEMRDAAMEFLNEHRAELIEIMEDA